MVKRKIAEKDRHKTRISYHDLHQALLDAYYNKIINSEEYQDLYRIITAAKTKEFSYSL